MPVGTAITAGSTLLELYKLSQTLKQGDNKLTFNDLKAIEEQAMSISQRAKQSVMIYPVLMSSSIGDIKLAADITKFLEIQYGIFTLLSLGVSTDITSKKASDVLSVVSAEGFNQISIGNGKELSNDIKNYSNENFKEYNFTLKENIKPRIGKYYSIESIVYESENIEDLIKIKENIRDQMDLILEKVNEFEKYKDKYNKLSDSEKIKVTNEIKAYAAKLEEYQNQIDQIEKKIEDKKQKIETTNNLNRIAEAKFITRLQEFKALPTVLNVSTKIGTTDVIIPIAIKAALHPIKSDEMRMILETGIEGKIPSIRITKALTGEIRIIKDLLLQMDLAERDKELYKTMGRHPWFRKLQERKTKASTNYLRKLVSGRAESVLPTASLVMTKDDLVLSTKLDYKYFLKNQKLLSGLMDSLFLLSLGIYDPELETISFFFSGFKDPFIYTLSELKKSDSDPNASLFEAVKNLTRKL